MIGRRAAPEIAATADWLNVERLGVVPMDRYVESLRGGREQERWNRVVADCAWRGLPARGIVEKIPVEMLEPLKMAQLAETSFFKTWRGQGRWRPMT